MHKHSPAYGHILMVDSVKAVFITIGKKLPRNTLVKWQQRLVHAGYETEAGLWLATRIVLIPLFALIISIALLAVLEGELAPLFAIAAFIAIVSVSSVYIYLKMYFGVIERTAMLEKSLPDFLMLMVSNLHAGMTPFDAFIKAARPEFGPLYKEAIRAAGKVGGKHSLEDAMTELGTRFASDMFQKTIELFVRATKAGGSIAKLLASNAEEIRRIQELRAELVSATRQQSLLLAFIVAVLMPFLLGIGYNFLVIFISTQSQLTSLGGGGEKLPTSVFSASQISIKPEEMFVISTCTLIITNFLVCMFMGVVNYGKALYGLKYVHYLLAVSLTMFMLTQNVLKGLINVN